MRGGGAANTAVEGKHAKRKGRRIEDDDEEVLRDVLGGGSGGGGGGGGAAPVGKQIPQMSDKWFRTVQKKDLVEWLQVRCGARGRACFGRVCHVSHHVVGVT